MTPADRIERARAAEEAAWARLRRAYDRLRDDTSPEALEAYQQAMQQYRRAQDDLARIIWGEDA